MPTIDLKHYGLLLAYAVLTAVINLVFSKRSQIDEWCEANPKLAAVAKLFRAIGVDPWMLAQSAVLFFTSKLPGYQKQSLADLSKPKPPSNPMGPMGGMLALALCLALSLTGCSIFGAHGSFWPVLEHCAPSPASLVSQVEDVLLAGGDYEAALQSIALKDGAGIVECAVAAAVDLLTAKAGKVGASPESAPAAARGKAFLAKVSAQ